VLDRRTILAVVLSFLVLFGSQWLAVKLGWIPSSPRPQATSQVTTPSQGSGTAPGSSTIDAPDPGRPSTAPGASPLPAAGAVLPAPGSLAGWSAAPDTIVTVRHPLYVARFQSRGARMLSVTLLEFEASDTSRVSLADAPALGLDLGDARAPRSLAEVPYAVAESLDASGRVAALTFTARDTSGLTVIQRFAFEADDYRIDYRVSMAGLPVSDDLRRYSITLRSWPLVTEQNRGEDLNNLGVTAKVGRDNKRELSGALRNSEKTFENAPVRWLAIHSKYFLLGLVGRNSEGGGSRAALAPGTLPEAHDQLEGTLALPLPTLGRSHEFTLYAGPLDYWRVDRLGMDLEPPHAMGFNWFKPFSALLVTLLKWFHSIIHNWGVAIILVATAAKLATHPLQASGMRSMRAMQKIQPEVERLRKKHDKDPQKLNTAIMALYKENKVNPLGGCLPMLLQMPFFLALYHVLGYAIDLRQAGFVGWITDLSSPDFLFQLGPVPVRVLPILMYGSMVLQMKTSPVGDKQQQLTMQLVNFVFLFLFYNLPSGLVLYWTVINLLTALQAWHIAQGDTKPLVRAA
jgi:YidC/Oxa1 family membrane protein insertase